VRASPRRRSIVGSRRSFAMDDSVRKPRPTGALSEKEEPEEGAGLRPLGGASLRCEETAGLRSEPHGERRAEWLAP
jgi:hypothetical protein